MICKMKCLSLISLLVLSLPVQLLAWFPGLDQTTVTDTICQHALYYSAGNVEPSRTSPPFRIILEQKSWLPKTSMKVQIKSTGEHKIQGLIIQMRSLRSQFSVGQFEMLEHAKLYNCDGKNDTVFYWSDTPKQDVILRWIHHSEDDETLRFVVNIFDESNNLWPNVTSEALDKGFPPIDVSGCGKTKGCFRYSVGKKACTADTCEYIFTYHVQGDKVQFEMSGTADWIAIGFSSDELMGGDDVLMCLQDGGRAASVKHYTTGPNHIGVTLESDRPILSPETAIINGRLSCRFTRALKVLRDETSVDLYNDCFHLYAWGEKSMIGTINRHTLDSPPTSERKVSLLMSNIDVISGTSGSPYSRQFVYVTTLCCLYFLYL